MVRNEARFQLVMLISEYSQYRANAFNRLFTHKDRQRSSNRSEMQEINDFWSKELRRFSEVGSERALSLEVNKGVDYWLNEFKKRLMHYVLEWEPR